MTFIWPKERAAVFFQIIFDQWNRGDSHEYSSRIFIIIGKFAEIQIFRAALVDLYKYLFNRNTNVFRRPISNFEFPTREELRRLSFNYSTFIYWQTKTLHHTNIGSIRAQFRDKIERLRPFKHVRTNTDRNKTNYVRVTGPSLRGTTQSSQTDPDYYTQLDRTRTIWNIVRRPISEFATMTNGLTNLRSATAQQRERNTEPKSFPRA